MTNVDNLIGIIGLGFVGQSLLQGYTQKGVLSIHTYDIDEKKNSTCSNLRHLCDSSAKYLFICVPTPDEDGTPNFSFVEDTCYQIDSYCKNGEIAIIKSTVLPSKLIEIQGKLKNITLVVNPEFLTQRTALFDFLNPTRMIWGCDNKDILEKVARLLGSDFFECKQYTMGLELAMKCKYAANSFGFVKVMYHNMLHSWVKSQEEYDILTQTMQDSGWVAPMHTKVPGPDEKLGVGGDCLPKDINAMKSEIGDKIPIFKPFLDEIVKANKIIRR